MFKVESLKERATIAILTVLLAAGTALAQRGGTAGSGGSVRPERVTDRPEPGTSAQAAQPGECDPATVEGTCPGTFAFIYGFNANASPRHGGAQSEKAGFAFNFYVTRRIFLELDNDNVISSKTEPAARVTGFGDTTFYVGADAVLEGKGHPGLTLAYGIKAPTADSSKGLGSGKVDHTLLGVFTKTLGTKRPRPTYLEFDIGDYIARRADASGFDNFPFSALVMKQWLDKKKKYRMHFELGGNFATSKSNAEVYTLEYLETKLSEHFALRTGGRFGLTPNVSRAGLYLGLKVTGNLKQIF
jgi:hypothetical protein